MLATPITGAWHVTTSLAETKAGWSTSCAAFCREGFFGGTPHAAGAILWSVSHAAELAHVGQVALDIAGGHAGVDALQRLQCMDAGQHAHVTQTRPHLA